MMIQHFTRGLNFSTMIKVTVAKLIHWICVVCIFTVIAMFIMIIAMR